MVCPPPYVVAAAGVLIVAVGAWSFKTVSTAWVLVAVPKEFETTHRYWFPSSPRTSVGVV
jgi:hypothetical protein